MKENLIEIIQWSQIIGLLVYVPIFFVLMIILWYKQKKSRNNTKSTLGENSGVSPAEKPYSR